MMLLFLWLLVKHMQFSELLAVVRMIPNVEVRVIDRYSTVEDVFILIALSINLLKIGVR